MWRSLRIRPPFGRTSRLSPTPSLSLVPERISYAQNGEDVRIWHAFGPRQGPAVDVHGQPLTYIEVGANEPWVGSVSAALHQLGWRGLLVEPDPEIVARLTALRPRDAVETSAAGAQEDVAIFHRVRGTGLGTLEAGEAQQARERGFEVEDTRVEIKPLDAIIDTYLASLHESDAEIHVLTIDVEGAEASALAGLNLSRHRPWVVAVEAVRPGTNVPSHEDWEHQLLSQGYTMAAFDGINRWYVAHERSAQAVGDNAGAQSGMSLAEAIAVPFHALDAGIFGWVTADSDHAHRALQRADQRQAWQRELSLNLVDQQVPQREYENHIAELSAALSSVQASRTFRLSRRISRVGKALVFRGRRLQVLLPQVARARIVRERHLRHVSANMQHLTHPAYLGISSNEAPTWSDHLADKNEALGDLQHGLPAVPPGLSLGPLVGDERGRVIEWLEKGPWDHDAQLDARMDNMNDEIGRTVAALRLRLTLPESQAHGATSGARILFDARALQTPAFGTRGIGRFAASALAGLRAAVDDQQLDVLIDPALYTLPQELVGTCRPIHRVTRPEDYGLLVQPSPMTSSMEPLKAILQGPARKVAVVYDFIPIHYPDVYLSSPATRSEYLAGLDALATYTDFICISQTVARELKEKLQTWQSPIHAGQVSVAWPDSVNPGRGVQANQNGNGSVVLMTGDEPRKNTFGGLAGIAAATSDEIKRDVTVVGLAGHDNRVHHWSIAAAMRPGEARNLDRITDEELSQLLSNAACVVVPSFDEGLSLPVIEAVVAGVPVVASDIPAHRELIGSGAFLADPANPRKIARAVRRVIGSERIARRQHSRLARHHHRSLEDILRSMALDVASTGTTAVASQETGSSSTRLNIGLATPWTPQPTGVADFSTTIGRQLSKLADLTLTVYTTADASWDDPSITFRLIDQVLEDPESTSRTHDVFITVVGNSHFHLPFVEAAAVTESVVIAHDTRMVEFYMALRGIGGAEQVMMRTPSGPRRISPPLSDQIDDMRLLQNAGMWELAQQSRLFITHSPGSATRIEEETSVPVHVLPFANQRAPSSESVDDHDRHAARERLGLSDSVLHVATFGYVDIRTKLTDVVVEAVGWLTRWGHEVALHVVGSSHPDEARKLEERAQALGLAEFSITGYVNETTYRDWLLAIDVGVQLRVSPLLGVSGPLSDLAAFGTPAVASEGLCRDVGAPAFIHRLSDSTSPVELAETIETVALTPVPAAEREEQRRAYLREHSPELYARSLVELITKELMGGSP